MEKAYGDLRIRGAALADAEQLCQWWNDGAVMAHAGFPNGLGTTAEKIRGQIAEESDDTIRRHIILYQNVPIGEMHYRNRDGGVCAIGIKICDAGKQNRGLGKIALSLFIDGLFHDLHYGKICLDTNLRNTRAQHVYEQLGFQKVRVNQDAWIDQLGVPQSFIDYELTEKEFISYLR